MITTGSVMGNSSRVVRNASCTVWGVVDMITTGFVIGSSSRVGGGRYDYHWVCNRKQ